MPLTFQQILLFFGSVFLCLSFGFHFANKERFAVSLLLIASFLFFFFAAQVYPFINVWDERFHALVSKNLLKHPLMPTLYDDPVINMAYDRWDRYHIWLHKQPLFMWQIALSFKIFGINEVSLRLPSVILSVFMVFAAYRSGSILGNKNIGLYSAILILTSPYLLKLISGGIELDQNDVAFVSYISLSLWAWLEYIKSKKLIWLGFIGLFSGLAILCKWLVGLLVYLLWIINSFLENKFKIRRYWDISIAFIITLLTFLPWQILTFVWYPTEAKFSLSLNSKHFSEVIDGHEGSFFYHFTRIPEIFGILVPYLLIPALVIFYKKCTDKKLAISFISTIVFVYLFFSLAVTKMPSFTVILFLPIYFSIAFLIDYLISKILAHFNKPYIIGFMILISFFLVMERMNFYTIFKRNSFSSDASDLGYKKALNHNKDIFTHLNLPHNTVLFNVKGRHYIEAMFYTGLPAYNLIPSEKDYNDLKLKGRQVAIFKNEDLQIPDYLNRNDVIILNDTIYICE